MCIRDRLLIHAVGKSGCGRLVDDTLHVQTGDLAGVLGGLTLGVVEVGRDGDDLSLIHIWVETPLAEGKYASPVVVIELASGASYFLALPRTFVLHENAVSYTHLGKAYCVHGRRFVTPKPGSRPFRGGRVA